MSIKESFVGEIWFPQFIREPDDWKGLKRWKISQVLKDEHLEKFKSLNTSVKLRSHQDIDGDFVTWTRPVKKDFGSQIVEFLPPEVVNSDGESFEDMIGNGTIARVEVEFFPLADGSHSHRLCKVVILDLVPYEGGEGFSEDTPGIARVYDKTENAVI